MPTPKYGIFQLFSLTDTWQFQPGRKPNTQSPTLVISLTDLQTKAVFLVLNKHLFKGWVHMNTSTCAGRACAITQIAGSVLTQLADRRVSVIAL